jgi:hypothetical protein
MIDRKELPVIRLVIGCAAAAYVAGEHLRFPEAPAKQTLTVGLATASSTSNVAMAVPFSTTTFAKVDPPPPVVPPGDRQQQG